MGRRHGADLLWSVAFVAPHTDRPHRHVAATRPQEIVGHWPSDGSTPQRNSPLVAPQVAPSQFVALHLPML
jgi:hypothetical protein